MRDIQALETDSTIAWLVLATSVAFFFVVSVAEASLTSVRRERAQWLWSQRVRGSEALESLHATPLGPAGALSPLRFVFLTSSLLSGAALVIASSGANWGLVSLASLATLLLLGVTHTAAGTLASAHGERVALRIASPVRALARLLWPLLSVVAGVLQRPPQARPREPNLPHEAVPAELTISVDADGEPLDEREVEMIRGVVRLDKTTAREIMVPRVDMVAAELTTPLDDLAKQMADSGHSRVPVYEGSLDQIKGIAYAKDVLGRLSREEQSAEAPLMAGVIRPALFIPETKTLEELLKEFQERQVHIAIAIDEYGGVSGLLTIEDLLEEIVGELRDEFDIEEPEIEPVGDNGFLMDARVGIDQLDELFHVAVEGDGFDTVGGFVYQRLGKIPSPGDVVEYDGLKIEVVSTVGRRLKRLRVTGRTAEAESG